MRTLIFGVNGQLGRDLVQLFKHQGPTEGGDLPQVDIASQTTVAAVTNAFRPDLVINAAAYTNVEAAEDNEAAAFRANETGAHIVAQAAAALNATVIYYSTDYVFGGAKNTPYEPDDPQAPIGVYARSKAAGETATRTANPRHFIVRTAWLFGPGGNNFIEKIIQAAQTRPELRVVDDEIGSPTHTEDLAAASLALAQTDAYGGYHAVNENICSRYAFAQAILQRAGNDTPIHPCASAEFTTKAERPLYSVLSNEKLQQATGHIMPTWQQALQRYMQRRT